MQFILKWVSRNPGIRDCIWALMVCILWLFIAVGISLLKPITAIKLWSSYMTCMLNIAILPPITDNIWDQTYEIKKGVYHRHKYKSGIQSGSIAKIMVLIDYGYPDSLLQRH